MLKLLSASLAAAALAFPAAAQPASAAAPGYPRIIPAPGGEAIVPSPGSQRAYDDFHYAPVRRAGDFLYISGVVAGPIGQEGKDAAAFRLQVRRAFTQIGRALTASGAGFGDVVMVNTFHVWSGTGFTGGRDEQFAIVSAVKDEFMPAPHPAWTAVGTTGLLSDNGVVEIQMIAYAPKRS